MVKKTKSGAGVLVIVFLAAAALQAAAITDDVGRVIKLDLPVKKVVSLSPAQTEMVYFLGTEEKLAAVSTRCDYPEEAEKKPKAGTFTHPDLEKIAAISPDCVFSGGGVQKRAIKKLEKLGIPVLVFYPRSLDGIKKDMETVAAVVGLSGWVSTGWYTRTEILSEKVLSLSWVSLAVTAYEAVPSGASGRVKAAAESRSEFS